MIAEMTAQIEYLINQSERSDRESKRAVLRGQIRDLTRRTAAEFGRGYGWRLTALPFTLAELAGVSDDIPASRAIFDHPYFYRDSRGRPVAIAVHLYDWPEVGPGIEALCEQFNLRYEAPAGYPSWWYPGWTSLVLYTPQFQRRRKRSPPKGQLDLPFEEGQWIA